MKDLACIPPMPILKRLQHPPFLVGGGADSERIWVETIDDRIWIESGNLKLDGSLYIPSKKLQKPLRVKDFPPEEQHEEVGI